jgi:hypothetical protein
MAPSKTKLTIAILECDTLLPLSHSRHDNYFGLYKSLLTRGAAHAGLAEEIEWHWKRYDVVRGELPAEEECRGWEGVVVSGASEWTSMIIFYDVNWLSLFWGVGGGGRVREEDCSGFL